MIPNINQADYPSKRTVKGPERENGGLGFAVAESIGLTDKVDSQYLHTSLNLVRDFAGS